MSLLSSSLKLCWFTLFFSVINKKFTNVIWGCFAQFLSINQRTNLSAGLFTDKIAPVICKFFTFTLWEKIISKISGTSYRSEKKPKVRLGPGYLSLFVQFLHRWPNADIFWAILTFSRKYSHFWPNFHVFHHFLWNFDIFPQILIFFTQIQIKNCHVFHKIQSAVIFDIIFSPCDCSGLSFRIVRKFSSSPTRSLHNIGKTRVTVTKESRTISGKDSVSKWRVSCADAKCSPWFSPRIWGWPRGTRSRPYRCRRGLASAKPSRGSAPGFDEC